MKIKKEKNKKTYEEKKKKKRCLRRAQPSVRPSFVQHPFDTAAVDAAADR